MDTGSTLYKRCQASIARAKKKKRKEAAAKAAKTRKENQRKRNEAAGLGYHSDNQIKYYKKKSQDMREALLKKREQIRKDGYNAYLKRKHAEMREREREKERERKKARHLKEMERRKKERKEAAEMRKRAKRKSERMRKKLLKHPIWQLGLRPYRIYVAMNGHCLKKGNLGMYKTLDDARMKIKELQEAEKDIIYERTTKTYADGTMASIYEYVIFKDMRDEDAKPTYLKNEYGKYVEHNVTYRGKNYEIVEKYPAKVEDTVWVFGYDPRNDRKTFAWVFNNILNEGFSSSYDMKRIYLYHNKVVFCNDKNEIDIVICKNARDAVRYYTTLQEYCKKGPYLFMGAVTTKSALCKPLEKLLVEKTGWEIAKLRRNQHRF